MMLLPARACPRVVGQVRAERVQAAFPHEAALAEPLLGLAQRRRVETAGAHTSPLDGRDHPCLLEEAEMLVYRRERHGEGLAELAHGGLAGGQACDHRAA